MKKGSEDQPQAEATNKRPGVMDCSSDYDGTSSIDVAFSMVSQRERTRKGNNIIRKRPTKTER